MGWSVLVVQENNHRESRGEASHPVPIKIHVARRLDLQQPFFLCVTPSPLWFKFFSGVGYGESITNSCSPDRTVSTGHGANLTTFSATAPNNNWAIALRPCVPITMRSTPSSLAALTISRYGVPIRMTTRACDSPVWGQLLLAVNAGLLLLNLREIRRKVPFADGRELAEEIGPLQHVANQHFRPERPAELGGVPQRDDGMLAEIRGGQDSLQTDHGDATSPGGGNDGQRETATRPKRRARTATALEPDKGPGLRRNVQHNRRPIRIATT